MPGTEMGPNASYKNPEAVKANLLEPVADKLRVKLGREVELVIEKDKRLPTPSIHASMFAEARDAEVYIADLTGANPNVYLELGVRWALRDRVTVLISQSVADMRFNVVASRAILYHPDSIIRAIADVVSAIEKGIHSSECDSLVRLNSEIVVVPKAQLVALQAEIDRLKRERGEDLVRAADVEADPLRRLSLLQQAVDGNPAFVEAQLKLGITWRVVGEYSKAETVLKIARNLDPKSAVVNRELGVCYSKQMKPALASDCLREAVRLAPKDAEAWSNLGGALRRLAKTLSPGPFDRKTLEEARHSYEQAFVLERYDLYAALNVARTDVLLCRWEADRLDQAKQAFSKAEHLCRYAVSENPIDYWRQFDLADILMFSSNYDESQKVCEKAIALIPELERKDKILSVLGPLRDYLDLDSIKGNLRIAIRNIVKTLDGAAS